MAFNVPLAGRIEPRAASWSDAPGPERLAFYRRAGEVAVRLLRAQLTLAVGATGARMPPRRKPRADGAAGPVLSPHYAGSRTIRLMAAHAWSAGVTVFWHGGVSLKQTLAWGLILEAHAAGNVRGAPARDVRASDKTVAKVAEEMAVWWATRQRRKAERRRNRPGESSPAVSPGAPFPLAANPYVYPPARAYLKPKAKSTVVQPTAKPLTKATMRGAEPKPPKGPGLFSRVVGAVKGAYGRVRRFFGG